jgi:hypothetical protein
MTQVRAVFTSCTAPRTRRTIVRSFCSGLPHAGSQGSIARHICDTSLSPTVEVRECCNLVDVA